jgi:hypothetical protein
MNQASGFFIVLEPTILDRELSLAVRLLSSDSGVLAKNLVEIEDLRCTIRRALQGKDVRGDVFVCTPTVQGKRTVLAPRLRGEGS